MKFILEIWDYLPQSGGEGGQGKLMRKIFFIFVLLLCLCLVSSALHAKTRTVSWDAVTTYTDNTEIEVGNLPILYDIWYVDSITQSRTDICIHTIAVSCTFSDALMVPDRIYYFFGKAFVQDNSASEDSPAYSWEANFIIPELLSVSAGFGNVSRPANFTWREVTGAILYNLQVATDVGFTNVVVDVETIETSFEVNTLAPSTKYFWRVRAKK